MFFAILILSSKIKMKCVRLLFLYNYFYFLLSGNPELSCWLTHWVCLILLIVLGCSNSLLVRGVYIDAEEPSGKCVIFPCYYLRVLMQRNESQKVDLQNCKQKAVALEKISVITTDVSTNHVCKKEATGT